MPACRDAQAETASGMHHRDGRPLDEPPCPFGQLAARFRLRNSTSGRRPTTYRHGPNPSARGREDGFEQYCYCIRSVIFRDESCLNEVQGHRLRPRSLEHIVFQAMPGLALLAWPAFALLTPEDDGFLR